MSVIVIMTSVWQQSSLQTTTHTTKVRTVNIFICCTGCVEQFATIASTAIWHCFFKQNF